MLGLGLDVGMVTASSHLTKHNRHMSTYGHKHKINTHTIISALLQRISETEQVRVKHSVLNSKSGLLTYSEKK